VTVAYSVVTLNATDITVTLNAGAGSDYDTLLASIELITGQRYAVYIPEVPIPLMVDDTIDVAVPAGGAAITSAAQILIREVT
jgi:hypothetical protein